MAPLSGSPHDADQRPIARIAVPAVGWEEHLWIPGPGEGFRGRSCGGKREDTSRQFPRSFPPGNAFLIRRLLLMWMRRLAHWSRLMSELCADLAPKGRF